MNSKLTQLTQQKSASELQTMSRDSYLWLTKKINGLRNPAAMAKSISLEKSRQIDKHKLPGYSGKFLMGGLYFFMYNPKLKHDLPYYDVFPLVMPLERYADGFLGLNLHYLPIKYRVIFMEKLMPFALYNDEDEIKRMRVTYDILNASRRFREFRPCLKRYLYPHIRSKILAVQPNEWDVAMFLPVHQFKKAQPKEVWQDSINEIRNS